jgi:hypothetical protein
MSSTSPPSPKLEDLGLPNGMKDEPEAAVWTAVTQRERADGAEIAATATFQRHHLLD